MAKPRPSTARQGHPNSKRHRQDYRRQWWPSSCWLLLCQLSSAAGQGADDPCARSCGRKLTCAFLYESFNCEVLSSRMGCNCSGCCLMSLSPLAPLTPPALPLPPLPPTSSPTPLFPPMAPGVLAVGSMTELRDIISAAAFSAATPSMLPLTKWLTPFWRQGWCQAAV